MPIALIRLLEGVFSVFVEFTVERSRSGNTPICRYTEKVKKKRVCKKYHKNKKKYEKLLSFSLELSSKSSYERMLEFRMTRHNILCV